MPLDPYITQENIAALMHFITNCEASGKPEYMKAFDLATDADGRPGLFTSVIKCANGLTAFEADSFDEMEGRSTVWDSADWYQMIAELAARWAEQPIRTTAEWQEVCRAIAQEWGAR